MAAPGQPSGTTGVQFPYSDLVVEALSRIGVYGPMIQTIHMVEARRTLNLLLQDWSANRGVNLFAVQLDYVTLTPGITSFSLPASTVQVLDVYCRLFQIGSTTMNLGNSLTAMVDFITHLPVLTQNGEPTLTTPPSGTLSSVGGSERVVMNWPAHGQQVGDPISFTIEASIGGLVLLGLYVVNEVIDSNTLAFNADVPASWTSTAQGATPLFVTVNGSQNIQVILPNHGLVVGSVFTVVVSSTLGGVTLLGQYTVTSVGSSHDFTFTQPTTATSTATLFENGGQLQFSVQQSGVVPVDLIMSPISRTEYAAIPNKQSQGRPTSFWFDRLNPPTLYVWQVAPTPQQGQPNNQPYAAAIYSMKQIDDANPTNGEVPGMPNRFIPVLAAELTAMLAEKFAPALFMQKMTIAKEMWSRASIEDMENVPLYVIPGLEGYYL